MLTINRSVLVTLLVPLLASCSSGPAKKLEGTWTIDPDEMMSMIRSMDTEVAKQSPQQQAALRDEMARDFGPVTFTKNTMSSRDARTEATIERRYKVLEVEGTRVKLELEQQDRQSANLNLELGEDGDTLRLMLDDNPKLEGAYIPYRRSTE